MLRCAITDGTASCFVNAAQIDRLQNQVRGWAADGIDLIQLREKNLEAGAVLALAEVAMQTLHETYSPTKLLINTRADVAIAARAHGVHLTSDPNELTPQQVRELFTHAGLPVESFETHGSDQVIDVEVTSNRTDCFSHVGLARELSALCIGNFTLPKVAIQESTTPTASLTSVYLQDVARCPYYSARIIRNVKVGPSPDWLRGWCWRRARRAY